MRTDLPPDEAKELMRQLDTLVSLMEKYFERKLANPIGMVVVKDLQEWPKPVDKQFGPATVIVLEGRGGHTLTDRTQFGAAGQALGTGIVIFVTPESGIPHHETVHAYCLQTFGRLGPSWYCEGMAEIGQYWIDKGVGVRCHADILKFVQAEHPRELGDIVDTKLTPAHTREDYAWWWALCHMLANNPNYAPQFRSLGLGLLNGKSVSFESAFGPVEREINFEYRLFLSHIDQGYRVDLCAWDWKAKSVPCKGSSVFNSKIDAQKGWQPAKISVEAGQFYDYSVSGTWKTSAGGTEIDANGDKDGVGRLVGIIYDDFKLSEPFQLRTYGSFTPSQSGILMMRCEDKWNELADNRGKVQVRIKMTGKGNPLPEPENKVNPSDVPGKASQGKAS